MVRPSVLDRSARLVATVAFAAALSPVVAPASVPGNAAAGSASTLHAVVRRIETSYVEPSRVDPGRMLWGAAAALDREIPEVVLESAPGSESLALRVAGSSRSFPASSVRSLASLEETLREIVRFVDEHRTPSGPRGAAGYAAINGMLETLDPHSVIFDPDQARTFANQVRNRVFGVGMIMDFYGPVPFVKATIQGGPAAGAGVAACDRILAVDGRSTAGLPFEDVTGHIMGPQGTQVWITFERDGTGLRELILTREEIHFPSVTSRLLEGEVGLIDVDHYGRGTAAEVAAAVRELKKAGASAWILDLRRNPGGLLSEAIENVGIFVESGPVVTVVGDGGREREIHEAKRVPAGPAEDAPMVVLISPGTASAAEVVAAALQNRNRAVVLGQTSFGKGSVQVLWDYPDGSELKLTIAHYVTPGGFSLQSRGVVPDVELAPIPPPRPRRVRLTQTEAFREAALEQAFAARVAAVESGLSLRYMASLPDREEEVILARDFLRELRQRSPRAGRREAIRLADGFFAARREIEEGRIAGALGNAGIDWTAGPAEKKARVAVRCAQRASAQTSAAPPAQAASDRVLLECEVRNDGDGDAFRVRGKAPDLALDLAGGEIVVGRVPAGSRRTFDVEGDLAKDVAARVTYVPFAFTQEGDAVIETSPVRIDTPARPAPRGEAPGGPEIRIENEKETTQAASRLKAEIRDAHEVRDAWVRVTNREARIDRKKAAYLARKDGEPPDHVTLSADVPLGPGLNEVEVCARNRGGQRCESAFVFRKKA